MFHFGESENPLFPQLRIFSKKFGTKIRRLAEEEERQGKVNMFVCFIQRGGKRRIRGMKRSSRREEKGRKEVEGREAAEEEKKSEER